MLKSLHGAQHAFILGDDVTATSIQDVTKFLLVRLKNIRMQVAQPYNARCVAGNDPLCVG